MWIQHLMVSAKILIEMKRFYIKVLLHWISATRTQVSKIKVLIIFLATQRYTDHQSSSWLYILLLLYTCRPFRWLSTLLRLSNFSHTLQLTLLLFWCLRLFWRSDCKWEGKWIPSWRPHSHPSSWYWRSDSTSNNNLKKNIPMSCFNNIPNVC